MIKAQDRGCIVSIPMVEMAFYVKLKCTKETASLASVTWRTIFLHLQLIYLLHVSITYITPHALNKS